MSIIEKFEAMLANGQDGEMVRFTLGNAYWKEGDPVAAVTHLEKAVELKPDWSAAWKILGRAAVDSGDLERAVEVFERGCRVAEEQGDKQTFKEINVFLKRAKKALDAD